MQPAMIVGDFVEGAALAFRTQDGTLVCGIQVQSAEPQWFPGLLLDDFSDGVAVASDPARKLYGAVNRKGAFVVDVRFPLLTRFADGRAFAIDDGLSLLDTAGCVLNRLPGALQPEPFHDGLAVLRAAPADGVPGRYGLVDRAGEFAIPLQYRWSGYEQPHEADARRCGEGLVCVETGGCFGYVDARHAPVLPPCYEGGRRFAEGLAPVRLRGRWGYIDRQQQQVLPPEWDDAMPFSEGLAGVERDGRWGFIDKGGKLVVQPDFVEVSDFADGHAAARTEFGCGVIDRAGRFVVPPMYDQVTPFRDGIARVCLGGTPGVLDRTLAVLWDDTVR